MGMTSEEAADAAAAEDCRVRVMTAFPTTPTTPDAGTDARR